MDTIDKLAWLHIQERKVLFVRSKGKDTFYVPGGKRELEETDQQALIREVKEELDVEVVPETITYVHTFKAQAHGKPEGVMVQITYYKADFNRTLNPTSEIEELGWLTSKDMDMTPIAGQLILQWLQEQGFID